MYMNGVFRNFIRDLAMAGSTRPTPGDKASFSFAIVLKTICSQGVWLCTGSNSRSRAEYHTCGLMCSYQSFS